MLTFTPDGAAGLDVDVDASATTLVLAADAGMTIPDREEVDSIAVRANTAILLRVVFFIIKPPVKQKKPVSRLYVQQNTHLATGDSF